MTYYRLKETFKPDRRDEIAADSLVFSWRASMPKLQPGEVAVTVQPDGWGAMCIVPKELLDVAPDPRWQEFDELLKFYMHGHDVPPNLILGTAESLDADLNRFVCSYGATFYQGRCKTAVEQRSGEQALAVVDRTQGGALTGEAVVLIYKPTWKKLDGPRAARFKLCDHNNVAGAGANPQRGWHPGRCSKCGLDLTVDSGD